VKENLVLGGHILSRVELQRGIDRALSLFPTLAERMRQAAGSLSGGEQQMLAIGRALMTEPRLLLLDEPSLGLAPLVTQHLFRTLGEVRTSGTTVLLVEQNVSLALAIADYAYVLANGRIDLAGTAEEVRATNEVERSYLGTAAP
jgi:branched-chain amino acid transport system ATP-binding protein